jgi:dolichol kinase
MSQKIPRQEINRKMLHFMALTMPVLIFYGPALFNLSGYVVSAILSVMVMASVVVEGVRLYLPGAGNIFFKIFGSVLREAEDRQITGSTYIICGAYLCAVILQDDHHISFMVLTLFIIGDAVAALAGKRFGKVKLGAKSLEGSLACFGVCLLLFCGLFPALPLLLDAWDGQIPLALILIISLAITVLELIPIKVTNDIIINDNMAVPPLAGVLMKFLYPLFSGAL